MELRISAPCWDCTFFTWLSPLKSLNQVSSFSLWCPGVKCRVYRYRYLCQLVNEPQVHRCASAQCDELSSDICLGMLRCHFVPQRAAHCSVEMWSLDGRSRNGTIWGQQASGAEGTCGTLFRVHLDSRLSSICWCKSQTQLKVQLSLLLLRNAGFSSSSADIWVNWTVQNSRKLFLLGVLLSCSHSVGGARLNVP